MCSNLAISVLINCRYTRQAMPMRNRCADVVVVNREPPSESVVQEEGTRRARSASKTTMRTRSNGCASTVPLLTQQTHS